MRMLEGTKYFYAFIQAMQQNDPDDVLAYHDHVTEPEVKCITSLNSIGTVDFSRRNIQITEGLFTTEIKYFCIEEQRELIVSIASMDMVDNIAHRVTDYLNGNSTKI